MSGSGTRDQQSSESENNPSIEQVSASEDTNALTAEQDILVRATDDQETTPWDDTFLEEGEGSGQQYQEEEEEEEEAQQTQEENNDVDERGAPEACIFVGSLNSQRTDDQLRTSLQEHFARWGRIINVKVCKDWMGRPYAFVQFRSILDSRRALAEAPGNVINDRCIRVESARVNRTLAISNFGGNLTEEDIRNRVRIYGQVEDITILPRRQRRPRTSYIKFRYRNDAVSAFSDLRSGNTQSPRWNVDWAANLDLQNRDRNRPDRLIDPYSIFIGQLNHSTTQELLEERFGVYGKIESSCVVNRAGERGMFGFVKYTEPVSATNAIAAENNTTFLENIIRVSQRELSLQHFVNTPSGPIQIGGPHPPHPPGLGYPAAAAVQLAIAQNMMAQGIFHGQPIGQPIGQPFAQPVAHPIDQPQSRPSSRPQSRPQSLPQSRPQSRPQSQTQNQNIPTSETDFGDTTTSPAYVGVNAPIPDMEAQDIAGDFSNLLIREGSPTDLQSQRDNILQSNQVSLPASNNETMQLYPTDLLSSQALNRPILANFPHGPTPRSLDSSSSHPNRQSGHNILPGQPLQPQQMQQSQLPQQPQQYVPIAGQPPYMGAGYYYPLMQENYQDPYYMGNNNAYGNYPPWLPSTVYPTTYYNPYPWPAAQSHSNLPESVSEPRLGMQNNNQEQPIQQFVQQPIQQSTQHIQQPLQQPPPLFQQPYQQPFSYPFIQPIPHFQPIRQPNQRSNQMSRQGSQQPPQNLTTTASNQSAPQQSQAPFNISTLVPAGPMVYPEGGRKTASSRGGESDKSDSNESRNTF